MKKVLKKVAKNNNVTSKEVETEISEAIKTAMENPNKSEEAKRFWDELSKDGKEPTAEDIISKIVSQITQKN